MKLARPMRSATISAVLTVGTLQATTAQTPETCQPFTVVSDGSQRTVEYLDIGNDGTATGDIRIGRRALLDAEGNGVGDARWLLTTLDPAPGSGGRSESFMNYVLSFDDGQIFVQYLNEAIRPADNTATVSVADQIGAVVGGTGAYSFARGTVELRFNETAATYDIDIRCD